MIMIPSRPYDNHSSAEKSFFDILENAFYGKQGFYCFHSLRLRNHPTTKFGEADYVIVCRYGVYVLEIKGGGVKYSNREWSSIDKNNVKQSIKDPFRQAREAMFSLKKSIKDVYNLQESQYDYATVFPNVNMGKTKTEYDSRRICDRLNLKDIEGWFHKFFSLNKQQSKKLSLESVEEIVTLLKGEIIPILAEEATELALPHSSFYIIRDKSYSAFNKNSVKSVKKANFKGKEMDILYLCKSLWRKRFVSQLITNERVVVSTLETLDIDKKRALISKYDRLIIENAESFYETEDKEQIYDLTDGFDKGSCYLYGGSHSLMFLFKDIEDKTKLGSASVRKVSVSEKSLKEKLTTELDSIIEQGTSNKRITILSPLTYANSVASKLSDSFNIRELNDFSIKQFPPKEITFAEISNFDGFRNETLIVIELDKAKR